MFFVYNKILHKFEQTIAQKKYERFLPAHPSISDIFLVSFPKSGNTWLRFLLANVLKVHYEIELDVNFFTIHEIIPDIYISRYLDSAGPFGRTDIPRIIKSHSSYNPYYFRVILLVRDPRDALISYYHYARERGTISPDYTLSQFIRSSKYGVSAWNEHTESWYLTLKQGQIVQIFLYEDLLKDPKAQLYRIMNLMGLTVEDAKLSEAAQLSSKEKMRESENTHRSTYLIKNKERSFVRKGIAQAGKDLSEEDRKYVEDSTRKIAQMMGYDY